MLVIDRYMQESIMIGDDIKITLIGFQGRGCSEVRLGFEAPKDVVILRKELTANQKNIYRRKPK